jgi:hypothetical protein
VVTAATLMSSLYKHTFLIIYPSGAYGTFLDWCINWFSGSIAEEMSPFTETGSAHAWIGLAAGDVTGRDNETIEYWLNSDVESLVLRAHLPLPLSDLTCESFQKVVLSYRTNFRKILVINNNVNWHLLTLHNQFTKIAWATYEHISSDIINHYKDQFSATMPIPIWQLREMMSFWHGRTHSFLTDIYHPIIDDKIINIDIGMLMENFENYLVDLFKKIDLPMTRSDRLTEIKEKWLSLQKFKDRDRQCLDIVSATVNGSDLDYSRYDLHILDEAFIQWKLRDTHGLDLLCHGLDTFPRTTQLLRRLLVPYVDKC